MKLSLSVKDDPRGQHCVLTCDANEVQGALPVIHQEVLKGRFRPVRESLDDGRVVYRFNIKFLDTLTLAFPMAQLSHGIMTKLSRAEEKRLEGMPIPDLHIPGFNGKLYNYQAVEVALITDLNYAKSVGYPDRIDYLNSEMGLGKTNVSLAAFSILSEQSGRDEFCGLVVCPNSAKYAAWAAQLDEFFPKLSYAVYDAQSQTIGERAQILKSDVNLLIVNFEAIRAHALHENESNENEVTGYEFRNPELFEREFDFGIIDEMHRAKSVYAQVTNGFFQLVANHWLLMSGTPVLNRPEEIFTALHKIYPDDFDSFNKFKNELCVIINGIVVGYRVEPLKELRDFLALTSIRHRKDQVLKDLPKVITTNRLVTLSTEERRIYDQIEEEMLLEMEDGTIKNIGGALGKIVRLKQACFSPELFGGSKKSSKIEELKEIVAELVASGEKAIIFSQWEKACQIIRRELAEYNPAYVTGKIKLKDRVEEIRKFNEDDDCVLYLGTTGANQEAITLSAATYVVFVDEGWVPAADDQAIGRSAAGGLRGAHLGKGAKVTVITLQAEDTYEQNAVALMKDRKRAIFSRTVERDGGKVRKVEKVTLRDLRKMLSRKAQKKTKIRKKAS